MNPFKKYITNYKKASIVINYYNSKPLSDEEKKWLQYLKKNRFFLNNNKFTYQTSVVNEYGRKKINVQKDEETQLFYVLHKGKKLYWPRHAQKKDVKNSYRALLFEQDPRSPHIYWNNDESTFNDKIFFDIGSAEGLIALEKIDRLKHVYLFECEEKWVEALQETFKPYMNKVTIIKKYVSNTTNEDDNTITIRDFVKQNNVAPDFIKMDIEGFEERALEGAIEVLENNSVNLAVCLYHTPDAEKNITTFFKKLNYNYEISKGCMIYDNIPPYFRHSVIRAYKKFDGIKYSDNQLHT